MRQDWHVRNMRTIGQGDFLEELGPVADQAMSQTNRLANARRLVLPTKYAASD